LVIAHRKTPRQTTDTEQKLAQVSFANPLGFRIQHPNGAVFIDTERPVPPFSSLSHAHVIGRGNRHVAGFVHTRDRAIPNRRKTSPPDVKHANAIVRMVRIQNRIEVAVVAPVSRIK